MNRIYRLVFNRNLGVLQVASEVATGHAGGGLRGATRLSAPLLPMALAWALAAPAHAGGLPSLSAASGANVSQHGATLTIDQNAAKAVLNWNSFNVGKDASVVFVQPSSSAVALNLIDAAHGASSIDGNLRANGNVFLINSAGILFGSTAKVNVGGLVASSLGLAEDDDHGYVLARGGHAAASVVNRGSIAASGGGSVNLVGNHVANSGAITAENGAIRLLSADQVKVTMDSAGAIGLQLVAAASQSVDGTGAAVENSGSLRAGSGQILLQAASNGLSDLLINNTGSIEASAIDTSGGSVRFVANGGAIASSGSIDVSGGSGGSVQLLSDAAVNVGGRIDASGTTAGGSIRIGGGYQGGEHLLQASSATVASDAVLDASATGAGNGGSIVVWSNGHTAVHGSLAANGAGNGDGGLLETSGHTVDFSGIAVAAKAAGSGAAGTWLVDPEDLSVDSAAASTIGTALDGGTNVTLITTSTTASGPGTVSSGGSGDINVNAAISWGGNTTLTLDAYHDINLNAAITATGDSAGLVLNYGGYTANGSASSMTDYRVNAPVTLGGSNAQLSVNGDAYTLLHSVDDLQNVLSNTGHYALAGDLDASGTTYGAPLIATAASTEFQGTFAGLGHTIGNLTITSGNNYVGLFGYVGNATIRDLGVVDATVSGSNYVGALAGTSRATLSNVYSSGSVTGGSNVGGLVGSNAGTITGAHSASNVTASNSTSGGLVGLNDSGTIADSYANGNVTSNSANVGGLVGHNTYGTVSGSYAMGNVTGKSYVGGLIGFNDTYSGLSNVYATGNVVGTAYITGGLVGMNYQGTITNAYATGTVSSPTSVGGLVGVNNPGSQSVTSSSINNSYATGAVSGTNNVGGLVGANTGSVDNAYWDVGSTGQANAIGSSGGSTANLGSITSGSRYSHGSYGNLGTWSLVGGTSDVYVATDGNGDAAWIMIEGQTRPFLASEYGTSIANAHQLQLMAYNLSASYSVSADIDASQTSGSNASGMWSSAGFDPIGDATYGFSGSLDGRNHTLSGLTITRSAENYVGLFGVTGSGSTIRDLTLSNSSVSGTAYVGGLVGQNASSISGVSAAGSIAGTGNFIGGLVGYNAGGAISGSQTDGSVVGSGGAYSGNYVGGLIGSNNAGSISTSSSTSTVSGGSSVGGLVGNDYQGTYDDARASGNVTSTSSATGNNVGGLIGSATQSTIRNVHATGEVTATTASAGGLVGLAASSSIHNAYASGHVSGTKSVGGLVGRSSSTTIDYVYATGAVTGSTYDTGGLVGSLSGGSIESAYAAGDVSGGSYVGGLVGYNDAATVARVYATGNVSGADYIGGLVGYNDAGSIASAYATGTASGDMYVAGLAGYNDDGTIANTYASGNVAGNAYVGGLVGVNYRNTISDSYATGSVSGTSAVGGLVGANSNGTIGASFFATTDASGNAINAGLNVAGNAGGSIDGYSGGKTWTQLTSLSTFTDAGWNIDDEGGTGLAWRIYDGDTTPLLRTFLQSLTVDTDISGANKTYDGAVASGTVSGYTTSGNVDSSLLFGASLRYATIGKDAGTYSTGNGGLAIGGLYSSQQGYDIGYSATGGVTIAQASLTVTASGGRKTYGDTASLSGYSVSGLVGGDTVSGVTLSSGGAAASAAVGRYAINASGATGTGLSNYVVSYVDGSLGVDPATLRIVATDSSKTYGSTLALSGYSVSGLLNGDTVSGVALSSGGAAASAGVGRYAINASGATGTGLSNYVVSYVDGSLSVDPATLRIVATDSSKTYGSTLALSGYSVSGLLNGDAVSAVSLSSSGAAAGAAVGRYAIAASGATGSGLSNYVIDYVDGVLTVQAASGGGTSPGIELGNTTLQAINSSVAASAWSGDAGSALPSAPQASDEVARKLAAGAQAQGGGAVSGNATIMIVDGGVRTPAFACSQGASNVPAEACIIQQ